MKTSSCFSLFSSSPNTLFFLSKFTSLVPPWSKYKIHFLSKMEQNPGGGGGRLGFYLFLVFTHAGNKQTTQVNSTRIKNVEVSEEGQKGASGTALKGNLPLALCTNIAEAQQNQTSLHPKPMIPGNNQEWMGMVGNRCLGFKTATHSYAYQTSLLLKWSLCSVLSAFLGICQSEEFPEISPGFWRLHTSEVQDCITHQAGF